MQQKPKHTRKKENSMAKKSRTQSLTDLESRLKDIHEIFEEGVQKSLFFEEYLYILDKMLSYCTSEEKTLREKIACLKNSH
jgi:hypothetical protein